MRIALAIGLVALSACATRPSYLMKGVDPLEPDPTPSSALSGDGAMEGRPSADEEIRRLQQELLEERAAREKLERLLDGSGPCAGLTLERVALARNVTGFRRYEASGREFRPSDVAVIYVEPRHFALKTTGEQQALHLTYGWKLFDDRGKELRVPAWENVDPRDREDQVAFLGPVSEFYQFFKLRLPANLAAGDYRVQVAVRDEVGGAQAGAFVDLTIVAVNR